MKLTFSLVNAVHLWAGQSLLLGRVEEYNSDEYDVGRDKQPSSLSSHQYRSESRPSDHPRSQDRRNLSRKRSSHGRSPRYLHLGQD